MKRIRPETEYDGDRGFPAVEAEELDRRRFLVTAFSGATAVGTVLLAPGESMARKRPRPRPRRPTTYFVYVSCWAKVSGCSRQIRGLRVITPSKALVAFLRNPKEIAGIRAVVKKALAGISCRDLGDSSRRARYERRAALALRKRYKKRTRKGVATPKVTLDAWQRPPNPGLPPRASFP